jgi:hypothetical protein
MLLISRPLIINDDQQVYAVFRPIVLMGFKKNLNLMFAKKYSNTVYTNIGNPKIGYGEDYVFLALQNTLIFFNPSSGVILKTFSSGDAIKCIARQPSESNDIIYFIIQGTTTKIFGISISSGGTTADVYDLGITAGHTAMLIQKVRLCIILVLF